MQGQILLYASTTFWLHLNDRTSLFCMQFPSNISFTPGVCWTAGPPEMAPLLLILQNLHLKPVYSAMISHKLIFSKCSGAHLIPLTAQAVSQSWPRIAVSTFKSFGSFK